MSGLFERTTGFFRPVVSLTFSINELLFGARPLGYGLTNLLVAVTTAGAVMWLTLTLRLSAGCAVLAGALWLCNFHGINMAVLWISGRTALMLTLLAVLAAIAIRTQRPASAAVLTLLAMLSKEEAVLLPIPLIIMMWNTPSLGRRAFIRGGAYLLLVLRIGMCWLVSGFAITVFLPVRSSLYACFPSVGSALAAAALVSALWRQMPGRRRQIYATGALVLPILLTPVYQARNVRWVELADFTSTVVPTLQAAARAATNDNLLLVDDRKTRVNLSTAFGALLAEATAVLSEDRRTVWMVPPPPGTDSHDTQPVPAYFHSAWMLKDGKLVEVDATQWIGARAVVMN